MSVEIKTCGLTNAEQAVACVDAGADAIGVVFYPKSPRNVSEEVARDISTAIKGRAKLVGVFVDMEVEEMLRLQSACGLDVLQLHGSESPEIVAELKNNGARIIKVLKDEKFLEDAPRFNADNFLLELGKGALPGGNAAEWDFSKAAVFAERYAYVLAGGLNINNIERAINLARPTAVDLSSAIEASPGIKDIEKVKAFISKVRALSFCPQHKKIF